MHHKRIAIVGSGDLARQIEHYLKEDGSYEVVGFFDDWNPRGEHILGALEEMPQVVAEQKIDEVFLGIGYKHLRARAEILSKYASHVRWGTFIHATAIVDKTASLGQGVVCYPGSIIGPNVVIEDGILINQQVSIAHDSLVKTGSVLAPSVSLAGNVVIGECCFLGIGSIVSDNCSISAHTILGAGAVVVRSIDQAGTYVGVPAKNITEIVKK